MTTQTTATQQMIRAHFMVQNGAVKAEVAREFDISPRTLGRWIEKVEAARTEAQSTANLRKVQKLIADIEAGHAEKEGTVQRRNVWVYVNPNPTMCADKKAAQNRVRDNKKNRKPAPAGAMADAFLNAKVVK